MMTRMILNETSGRNEKNKEILSKAEAARHVPHPGDRIRITKLSIHTGASAGMQPGESTETVLRSEIAPGENIVFDGGNTSAARKADVVGGKVVVHTETSIYEIQKL